MRREFVSGKLTWKDELKTVKDKDGNQRNVLDFAILENSVQKYITAWDEKAVAINEIPKGNLVLASCFKSAKEVPKKEGETFTKYKEEYIAEKVVTDPVYVKELFAQYDKMMRDFNEGKIDILYKSEEQSLYKGEKTNTEHTKEEKAQEKGEIER